MQDSGFSGWANTGESFDVVNEMALQPISLRLAVRPNPFNPSTALSYKLQAASHVSLKVYDTGGRLVAALVEGWRAAGEHQAIFDGTGLASGIYLAKLTATSGSGTTPTTGVQKLVLLK